MIATCIRLMIAAGAALLLVGCNVTTVETKVEAPTAMSGTLYVGAPVRPRPLPYNPPWISECHTDRFQDRQVCAVALRFDDAREGVFGSLVSLDGRVWYVASYPFPTSFRLRVDQHPVIASGCPGAVGHCRVPPAPGNTTLLEQIRNGRKIALQVLTTEGGIDRDFPIIGFQNALAEARAMTPPAASGPDPVVASGRPAARPTRTAPASSGAPSG